MENWYKTASDYIESHRNEIVEDLKALARIPSLRQPPVDGCPLGKPVDDVLVAAAALFEKSGLNVTVYHEDGYALATSQGVGDGIGIFGHADVVPVNDDWVKTTPFAPIEEDGILYGRGVSDNKAGVIGGLYALRALQAAGNMPKSRISVFIGGCEETAMSDVAAFARDQKMPAVCIVPDSDFPVSVGEKGILNVDCRSKRPLVDVKKLQGGMAYNVILDHVDVAVAKKDGLIIEGATEENGLLLYSREGLTSHAARPEGSVNAARKAALELLELPICENDKQILAGFAKAMDNNYGETLDIASEGVFGKLTCVNGIIRVEEDGHLFFTLDSRYGNEVDSKASCERLLAALDRLGFDGTIRSLDDGFLLDESGKAMEIILGACREVCNEPDAQPFKTYGGTYARHLKNAYAISHSGPHGRTDLGLPAGHGGAHQSDEMLDVEAFLEGIRCMTLMIGRLDAWLTE